MQIFELSTAIKIKMLSTMKKSQAYRLQTDSSHIFDKTDED